MSSGHSHSRSSHSLSQRRSFGTDSCLIDSPNVHKTSSHSLQTSSMSSSILPRVNGYKRVDDAEGGSKPMRVRFGWKKFAIAAVVIVALVVVFGPRERRDTVIDTIKDKTPSWPRPVRPPPEALPGYDKDKGVGVDTPHEDDILPTTKPISVSKPGSSSSPPKSPAEDPDPLGTVHCTSPHTPGAKLVQYALMIDAGSTGSRIHIYKFNNCGPSPAYEYEVFKMTNPGLSAFKGDAVAAASSLDVLLDEAVKVVPDSLWSCTPVAVKATAGLRLLGAQQSLAILDAVRDRLEFRYPFKVVEKDGVVIMDGKDEGVYAWITANYLLNTIRADSPSDAHSYAVLDLGGGSTQIVFEPDFKDESNFVDGDHKYELQFGGKTRTLYQHSYLGYGLMSARRSVHRLVEFIASFNKAHDTPSTPSGWVGNPCLNQGSERVIDLDALLPGEEARSVKMVGSDIGSFEACNRVVEMVLAKNAICQVKPCSFNGVYQPSILETFAQGNVLLLSYFYDRVAPFLAASVTSPSAGLTPADLSVSTFANLAETVCLGPEAWASAPWGQDKELIEELEGRPEECLDLTFMHALLRLGYEFPSERGVRMEKKVDGTELGWCLGATIAIVGGELTCRV